MTRDEARQYFKDKKLTYGILCEYTIDLLVNILQFQILKLREEDEECFLLRVNYPKYSAKQKRNGNFRNVEITVDGTYFSHREAITFSEEADFIGFAGWADNTSVQPFLNGFTTWCDALKSSGS